MTENKKPSLKQGEKILFGIVGVFILIATISFAGLEVVRARSDKPMFQSREGAATLAGAGLEGSAIFRESGCTACHRALRNGTNMGLSLDGVGSRRTLDWLERFLLNPEQTYESATIDHGKPPKEASYVAELSADKRHKIASFLAALTSAQGSPSSPLPPEGRSQFIDDMVKVWAPSDWKEKYKDIRQSGNEAPPVGEGESK